MSCLHPKYLEIIRERTTPAYPERVSGMFVPCGKCLNCLKKRQTDYSTRIYREAQKGTKMWFVTFTYRPDALPFAQRLYRANHDTGELEPVSNFEIVEHEDILHELRGKYKDLTPSYKANYIEKEVLNGNGFTWIARYCPTLNRYDVRYWLKKVRIYYKRFTGENLPTFRYAFCGEYGSRGGRPHYHALIFGLDSSQLNWILKFWNDAYGYTYVKEIPILNQDGSDARLIVSRYVGKYISKGKFDLDAVKAEDCEKGRLCNSKRLGTELTEIELAHFRCYDLFGEYDIARPEKTLSNEQIEAVARESLKRNVLQYFNGNNNIFELSVPKALRRHIWYYRSNENDYYPETYDKNDKNIPTPSYICRVAADILRSKLALDCQRKFESLYSSELVAKGCIDWYTEFFIMREINANGSEERIQESCEFRRLQTDEKDNQ